MCQKASFCSKIRPRALQGVEHSAALLVSLAYCIILRGPGRVVRDPLSLQSCILKNWACGRCWVRTVTVVTSERKGTNLKWATHGWERVVGEATGIYLTKHSCVASVHLCFVRKEIQDYSNTISLDHSNERKHHKALACTRHIHKSPLLLSSRLSFPPGPSSNRGSQKTEVEPR